MKTSPSLREAFASLEQERDRLVLRRRYVDGETFETIGLELGVSRERARQLTFRAEKRLATHLLKRVPPPAESVARRWRVFDRRVDRPEPFGTLDEILNALEPFTLHEKTFLLDDAINYLELGFRPAREDERP